MFPNAACVVSLVDRLVHRAEVLSIEGESYRLKEARESAEARSRQRAAKKIVTEKGAAALATIPCCRRDADAACRSSCLTTGHPSRRSPCSSCSTIYAKSSARAIYIRSRT